MKLSFILLIVTFFQANAMTFAQKVNMKVVKAPLNTVFYELSKQTGYNFVAEANLSKKIREVSVDLHDVALKPAIEKCFEGIAVDIVFKEEHKTVFIKEMPKAGAAAKSWRAAPKEVQQQIVIKGVVADENGEPLPAASIAVKGTRTRAISDVGGNFKINVPNEESILLFSHLAYRSQEWRVGKNRTFSIQLLRSVAELDDVVVTALGIRREEKALGYAVTTVDGEQLTEVMANNWTEALSGKVAGLDLVRSGAGPTGSNRIILRGESNLTGDNDALIVLDGVIINNSSGRMTGTGSSAYLDSETPVDYGTSLNDINPEDIESVSVLKGPGAAALYGQLGANGAIIITTKAGRSKPGAIGVSLRSVTSINTIMRWPDYQYEYGSGNAGQKYFSFGRTEDGPNTSSSSESWGPRFAGQMFYQYDPVTHAGATERTPWVPYPNNRKDFFNTGLTLNNTVSVDGGTDRTTARFSFTNVDNSWIIPNTGYQRNTVALSVNSKITDKLQISSKLNYTNKKSDNLPAVGYSNKSVMNFLIMQVPNGNLDWLKDYWMPGMEGLEQSYPFSSSPSNPYVMAYEMLNKLNRRTITGNVSSTYSFNKALSLMVRTSMDLSYENRSQQRPMGSRGFQEGMFRTSNIFSADMNGDFMFKYDKKVNTAFDFSISAGGSTMRNNYTKDELRANRLQYPQIFTLANSRDVLEALPLQSAYVINSLYGMGTIGYRNYLFMDITARNDWNSVLATPLSTDNVSFFYPSVNLSAIFSEIYQLPAYVSLLKLRASYAGVGSGGVRTYQNTYTYQIASNFPGGIINPTILPNEYLKPQFTTSYEIGADIRLFKNRLGLDIAAYTAGTSDQILTTTLDRGSGYNSMVVNGGLVRNRGLELQLNGVPFKNSRGFNWKVFATFAANENTVVELTDSLFALRLQNTISNRGSIEARVGGDISAIYGSGYQRAPEGQVIYENGYPLLNSDAMYLGNSNPRWRASLGNEFRYKQFTVNILVDGQYGGHAYSLTHAMLGEHGKLASTLPGRYNGIIGEGVIQNEDGTYRPNDVVAHNIWTYYKLHYGRENIEGGMFKTDFLKLREVRVGYTFSSGLNKQLGLERTTIGIYGRDLLMLTRWPAFDPEFGTLNNGSIDKGFEIAQFPATSTFGVNLSVTF